MSYERTFAGCETLFDRSGSSASFPGLLKVVKFFSSLLGFTVSANETLVGDFLGLGKLEGLLETEAGELDCLPIGFKDGLSGGRVDGLFLGEMDGPLDGSVLGKSDGPF